MLEPAADWRMLSVHKAPAAGPTSNLYGCWNQLLTGECYPSLRHQLLALHQTFMDAGTMALKIHTFSAAGIKSEGLLASGFSIHLRPELLALHQISMDAGTMALKIHTFSAAGSRSYSLLAFG